MSVGVLYLDALCVCATYAPVKASRCGGTDESVIEAVIVSSRLKVFTGPLSVLLGDGDGEGLRDRYWVWFSGLGCRRSRSS